MNGAQQNFLRYTEMYSSIGEQLCGLQCLDLKSLCFTACEGYVNNKVWEAARRPS